MRFILPLLLAAACGNESVSFNTVEEARGTARENSLFNAQAFRQQSPDFVGWDIQSRGDSSQTNECPQGDGWATLTLISPDKSRRIDVKCSTVSPNIQCLPASEFKTKPFATEDGICADVARVPFPLPKIAK
jgi:hypothetical protein